MKQLTDENFETELQSGAFLVDFYADWCGPCRMMVPVLEEIAESFKGKLEVVKIDIDAHQKAAAQFQVTSIPTLVLIKDGSEVGRMVGMRDAAAITTMLSEHL